MHQKQFAAFHTFLWHLFPNLKYNSIAYHSSKVSSRPDCIFQNHQLWQSSFSRVYSNSCCSCSFKPEIIRIGQLSNKMYSNIIPKFSRIYDNFKCLYKKVWKLIEGTTYIFFLRIFLWYNNLCVCMYVCVILGMSFSKFILTISPSLFFTISWSLSLSLSLSLSFIHLFFLNILPQISITYNPVIACVIPEMNFSISLWLSSLLHFLLFYQFLRPARTYIQQLCEDTGCNPEDLPEAMSDREKWRETVRDIRADGATWWWYITLYVRVSARMIPGRSLYFAISLISFSLLSLSLSLSLSLPHRLAIFLSIYLSINLFLFFLDLFFPYTLRPLTATL